MNLTFLFFPFIFFFVIIRCAVDVSEDDEGNIFEHLVNMSVESCLKLNKNKLNVLIYIGIFSSLSDLKDDKLN